MQSLDCIPNPFITESFVLINSNQTSPKICNKLQTIPIDIIPCHKDCPKNCLQHYNKLKIETSISNYHGDSYFKIVNEKKKQFSYKAESELNFIKYIADLGGLFGLYLGISVIDMAKIIKYSIALAKQFLNYIKDIKIFKIIVRLKIFLMKLKIILNYFDLINFTLIAKITMNPIFIYELLSMINLYFQYSTQTHYQFIVYNISHNRYSLNEFPAITVCNEQIFNKIWFQGYYDIDNVNGWKYTSKRLFKYQKYIQKICHSSSDYLTHIQNNITNEHVKKSIFTIIVQYFFYYIGILPISNGVNTNTYCHKYISMLDFIVNKFMANDNVEFGNKNAAIR